MGGTPHANATHFPNDESLELELGDWIKPSIAEVLDRGGGCCRERGRAYPVPSPRGTLPTWIPSGDGLNLVHNRQTIQPGAGEDLLGFFFWCCLLSLRRPGFTSFAFTFLPSTTEAWVVLRPHPICHKSQEHIRRGQRSLVPRHGPIQGKPSSRLRLPDHAITILPPPLADLVVRDSKLSFL